MSKSRLALVLLLLAVAAHIAYYYGRVPDSLASHFGGSGRPNAWSSRTAFFGLYAALALLMAAVFGYMPLILARMSASSFNIPHREYWLSGERRAESLAFIGDRMARMGSATLLFMMAMMQLVIVTNFRQPPTLPTAPFLIVMGAYMINLAVWILRFRGHFKRP